MKKDIHPKYFKKVKVKCACGNEFEVGSTMEEITVELCSACHPFWTGEHKITDTVGRVERMKKRVEAAQQLKKEKEDAAKKKSKKK